MARVRLGRYEAEEGRLPPVCMRCGADADGYRRKQFSWHPEWVYALIFVGLVPFIVVALVLTKRMRVRAPLCRAHTGHWLWRTWFTLGSFFVVVVVEVALGFLSAELSRRPDLRGADGWVCAGMALLGLVWLVVVAVVQSTAIRAAEITDRDITLTGVSPAFADEVRETRRRRRRDEDDERPRRRARYEDEEDDYYER